MVGEGFASSCPFSGLRLSLRLRTWTLGTLRRTSRAGRSFGICCCGLSSPPTSGTINASMLIMAAALFHSAGLTDVGDIDKAFEQLRILEGNTPAILFGVALLASGLSSSSVGTLSGQVVMQGFISRQIPLFLRRLITMMPALLILAIGLNPSRSLVISQVVLSFGIPFALVPLLIFCRNRDVMGTLVNHRLTTTVATVVVFLIVSLNVFLLYQTFFSA